MATFLDHLVVTAPSLEIGAAFVHLHLGAMPQSGGAHEKMGTHNLLLRLDETAYLEVIAVDPGRAATQTSQPSRLRWFDLDRMRSDTHACLAAWVARTDDVRTTSAHASEDLGAIARMTRGDLTWLITIPHDGRVRLDGCAPLLIEWQGDVHPASRLPDAGLRLVKLELHPREPERLQKLFDTIDLSAPIGIVRTGRDGVRDPHARLVATIATPRGLRTIASA